MSILFFQALQASKYEDWFWKVALGKCYFRLGMYRDAERMFKSALKMQEMIDILLFLAKVKNMQLVTIYGMKMALFFPVTSKQAKQFSFSN